MNAFKTYLEQKGMAAKTIKRISYCSNSFENYLKDTGKTIQKATYNDLLGFIGHLQSKGTSKVVINEHLRALGHYFEYLKLPNIAYDVRLRGIQYEQKLFFSEDELSQFYNLFESPSNRGYYCHSDKIILGLIIYQGLEEKDIYRLEQSHVNLEGGKIYIPGGSYRKNGRWLKLEAHQILPLHAYMMSHRKGIKAEHLCNTDKLFIPNCEKEHRLHGQLKLIAKQLREQTKEAELHFEKLNHLRHSRLAIWVKLYGLRKAQYMAGYRLVETIERYRKDNPDDLKEQVLKFHPLR